MLRGLLIAGLVTLILGLGGTGFTLVAARTLSGSAPAMAPQSQLADFVLVEKSQRRLTLMQGGEVLATYIISMGANADDGHKQFEGDERTPEGRYVIDWRNENSIAHLSLHISYPSAADTEFARAQGRSAGGNIMIHGLPNGWGFIGAFHRAHDWTDGCIAVTNEEMREIWSRVPNGTPIEIRA